MALVMLPASQYCDAVEQGPLGERNGGYPAFLHFVTDTLGPVIGRPLSYVRWRRGYLEADPAFRQYLTDMLHPFDIIVVKNGYKVTDKVIPGVFGHAAVWLGDEAQLRAEGLWEQAAIAPLQDEIRAGRNVLEAVPEGAKLVSIETLIDADRLAVVRVRPPDDDPEKWHCDLANLAIEQLQRPYDYSFDVDSRDKVSCAELVYRAFRDVAWETRILFGRRTIVPDDIIRIGLSDEVAVDVVAYFRGAPDGGWQERPVAELTAELDALCGD